MDEWQQDAQEGATIPLAKALGYIEWKSSNANNGVKIHDQDVAELTAIMSWCYPLKAENIGFTKNMFAFYDMMAKLLLHTICAKVGDPSAIRGTILTLFKYFKPEREKKIDVIHFLYSEFKTIVEDRRNPTYALYVQALILQETTQSIMSTYPVAKHGYVQIVAQWDTKQDPGHPTLCPSTMAKAKASGRDALGSSSQATHWEALVEDQGPNVVYAAPKKKSFTYQAQKAMMSYLRAIHHRTHKFKACSKLALSLVNKDYHRNGEDIPEGPEDKNNQLEVFDDPFSDDDVVKQPKDDDDDAILPTDSDEFYNDVEKDG